MGKKKGISRGRGGAKPERGSPQASGEALLEVEDWRRVQEHLGLSQREIQVVQHIFKGKKLSGIAHDMGLSLGTVKTYSQRVYHKLHISDQRELTLAVMGALKDIERS